MTPALATSCVRRLVSPRRCPRRGSRDSMVRQHRWMEERFVGVETGSEGCENEGSSILHVRWYASWDGSGRLYPPHMGCAFVCNSHILWAIGSTTPPCDDSCAHFSARLDRDDAVSQLLCVPRARARMRSAAAREALRLWALPSTGNGARPPRAAPWHRGAGGAELCEGALPLSAEFLWMPCGCRLNRFRPRLG